MPFSSLALSLVLAGAGLVSSEPGAQFPSDPVVLARWSGGELDEERFRLLYDPGGKALARGGKTFKNVLCKAVYREIYQARALASGLDRRPEVIQELSSWRLKRLAQLYRERHYAPAISDDAVRAVYQRDLGTTYLTPTSASLDVLFVRCGTSPAERELCRARMDEHSRRLAAGEPLAALVAEEKSTSGEANGHFKKVSLGRLDPALARVAAKIPVGETSQPLETLLGWVRLRLTERSEAAPAPFEAVAPAVRQQAEIEAREQWQAAEVARLRAGTAAPPLDPEEVLAAAAVAAGLATAGEFLAEEAERRSWILADAAFLSHAEVLPSDEQLARQLGAQDRRFRRWRLVLATLPAEAPLVTLLAAVERVKGALAAAPNPARRLASLGGELPDLVVEEVGPATAEELGQRSPRLAALLDSLAAGAWRGPEPLGWRRLPPLRLSARPPAAAGEGGLLFLAVEESMLPPLAEARRELLMAERSKLGASVESFLATLGPVWKIELLVP